MSVVDAHELIKAVLLVLLNLGFVLIVSQNSALY